MRQTEIIESLPAYLLHSNNYSLVITNLEGNYIFTNDIFKKRFAFLKDDFIGMPFYITIHPDDVEKCNAASYQCIMNPDTVIQVQARKPDNTQGDFSWTSWEFSLFKDAKGQAAGILCLGHDITETEENSREIKAFKEKEDAVIEKTTGGFFILNRTWCFIKINQVAADVLKISKTAFIGKSIWEIFADTPENNCALMFHKAMENNEVLNFEDYNTYLKCWFAMNIYPSVEGLTVFFRDVTSEKNTQAQLLYTKNKLRAMLDSSTDHNILIDHAYNILCFNKTANSLSQEIFEKDLQENTSVLGYILPQYITDFYENIQKAFAGETVQLEKEISFKKTSIWFKIKYFPVYDAERKMIGVMCNIVNIDIEKYADIKLKKSAYMLNAIYNSHTDASMFIDTDFKVRYSNRIANEICLYLFGNEAQKGDSSLNFILPALQAQFMDYYKRVLEGETFQIQNFNNKKWWLFSLFPVYDAHRKCVGIAHNIRDITRRKTLEIELRASQESLQHKNDLLNAILESPKGMIIFSLDKNYRYLSFTKTHKNAMKQIWGVDIEIGQNMLAYISYEADRQAAKCNFDKALKGEYFIEIEMFGDEKLYRTYWEDRYSPMLNAQKEIIGLTVFVTDVTQRRQDELKILAQNEQLKAIAWQQAHQVRRPVANILGLIDLIKTNDNKGYNETYLNYLLQSTQELDAVIHKIVGYANEDETD